jgi:hypothetical protein
MRQNRFPAVARALTLASVTGACVIALSGFTSAAGGPTNFVSMFRTDNGQCYADLFNAGGWNPNSTGGDAGQNDANEEGAMGRASSIGKFMGVRPIDVAQRQAPRCSGGRGDGDSHRG